MPKKHYQCFSFEESEDGRQFSPSAARNGPYILKILKRTLPKEGTVLEVASGTGEHTLMFAPEFQNLVWQPSDPAEDKLVSIQAWLKAKPVPNILPPIAVDATAPKWPVEEMDLKAPVTAMICINMIHISPWEAGQGLLAAAGRILPKKGILYLYGPYNVDGKFTAPSNQAFNETLKQTDPRWGLRDLSDVEREAEKNGLKLQEVVNMPANNFSVIFEKI